MQIYSTNSLFLSRAGDPLIGHGRHFGQTVHTMCSVQALITKCIVYLEEEEAVVEETLTYEFVSVFLLSITSPWADMVKCRARRELQVFRKLMKIPQLRERLMKR